MRKLSASHQFRVFLATSVCASHINHQINGFRQKDVKFYTELFTNWMECHLGQNYQMQNTQIQRYLDQLVARQLLSKSKNDIPVYHCKNSGLLELISSIAEVRDDDPLEMIFFQFHVLELYHDLLFNSVSQNMLELPHSLRIELKYLLDSKVLIEKQKVRIKKEIEKLTVRKNETLEMVQTAEKLLKEGKSFETTIKVIEKTFPYQLNNQLNMSALFKKLNPAIQKAELTTNANIRARKLWGPLIQHYQDHLNRLEALHS